MRILLIVPVLLVVSSLCSWGQEMRPDAASKHDAIYFGSIEKVTLEISPFESQAGFLRTIFGMQPSDPFGDLIGYAYLLGIPKSEPAQIFTLSREIGAEAATLSLAAVALSSNRFTPWRLENWEINIFSISDSRHVARVAGRADEMQTRTVATLLPESGNLLNREKSPPLILSISRLRTSEVIKALSSKGLFLKDVRAEVTLSDGGTNSVMIPLAEISSLLDPDYVIFGFHRVGEALLDACDRLLDWVR